MNKIQPSPARRISTPKLNDKYFRTLLYDYHWTQDTAISFLQLWLDYLN